MPDLSQDPPRVSVLIPVLNEAEYLAEALEAMRRQAGCGGLELLVIDGGSTDATEQIALDLAHADPRIRLLRNPHRHTPGALNIGLHAARGQFVARMDAHTIYPENYLARGIERLEEGGVAWVSGPQIPLGQGDWSRRVALALGSRLGVGGAAFRSMSDAEIEVDSGFTGLWRRDLLLELGGWDEGWPINQDGELAGRIREGGGQIVCLPEMAASYIPRDSLQSLARQYWRYGQYKAKTCRRHPTSMRRSHLLPPGLVGVAAVTATPGRLGRTARAAILLYLFAVGSAAAQVDHEEPPPERLAVAAVLVVMHACWGAGFIVGSFRFGVPAKAILCAAGASLRRGDQL